MPPAIRVQFAADQEQTVFTNSSFECNNIQILSTLSIMGLILKYLYFPKCMKIPWTILDLSLKCKNVTTNFKTNSKCTNILQSFNKKIFQKSLDMFYI